jgi:ribosome-associated protein
MIEKTIHLPEMVAAAASEKKAREIVILEMQAVSPVTDHFVICSANSTVQVQAIADNIEEKLAEQGVVPIHKEGYRSARWVLLDYGGCVVHVFLEEDRNFYNLENLWSDAPAHQYEA